MTNRDRFIKDIYTEYGINDTKFLNMAYLSNIFNIMLCFDNQASKIVIWEDFTVIIIDNRLNDIQQLEDFYHELAHYLLHHCHVCNHDYIELKADGLIPSLAMPIHLLDTIDFKSDTLIHDLSETFHVSHELAYKRVQQIRDKLIDLKKVI